MASMGQGGIASDSSQDATSTSGMGSFQTNELKGGSNKPGTISSLMELGPTSNQSKIESVNLKRRSSSRSIKRRKFDDELVESSLIKTSRPPRPSISNASSAPGSVPLTSITTVTSNLTTPSPSQSSEAPKPFETSQVTSVTTSTAPTATSSGVSAMGDKKKPSKTAPKRNKKPKNQSKEHGKWKPTDDLTLILGVQQTMDLEAVYLGTKFSSRFSLQDLQEHWYALLYDPTVSKAAVAAIKQLHPDVVHQIHANALFSEKEEKLLANSFSSTNTPSVEQIQELMNKNPDVFLPQRTPKSLLNHWLLMKQYQLLPDQAVIPWPTSFDQALNISDAEDFMDDAELQDPPDETIQHEIAQFDRKSKREIKQLENELPKWQVIVDSITGVTVPDFDNQTLAVLRGRLVRYLMRSREITLGRSTKDHNVDVDLSLEGPAWKVSRRQGVIRLHNGEFFLYNEGKRPFYIDSKPVLPGTKAKMNNNAVIEIGCLRFIFLINQDLISTMRPEAVKT